MGHAKQLVAARFFFRLRINSKSDNVLVMACSSLQKAATKGVPYQGGSKGAAYRRARSAEGAIYAGSPGETITMSDREYFVSRDGSFRRIQRIGR